LFASVNNSVKNLLDIPAVNINNFIAEIKTKEPNAKNFELWQKGLLSEKYISFQNSTNVEYGYKYNRLTGKFKSEANWLTIKQSAKKITSLGLVSA